MFQVETHGAVARVTLDRPEIHNALNDVLLGQIAGIFDSLGRRDDVRAIVLAGHGKSFCAGADLNWMRRVAQQSREENLEDAKRVASTFLGIATCPKPVIARIHGAALGGGSGLAAAADISIAVETAQFGFTEVKLGIIPALIAPVTIAKIGAARTREYFLTGERFSAARALEIGLVQHVVADEAAMDALIDKKIAEFMTSSPAAITRAKALIFGVAQRNFDEALDFTANASADSRASEEGQAGMGAFLTRSTPPWIPS
jgi:methylglutaconyl-CoA hydratase